MFQSRRGGRCGVHTVSRLTRGNDGSLRNCLVLRHFSGVLWHFQWLKSLYFLGKLTVTYGEGLLESTFLYETLDNFANWVKGKWVSCYRAVLRSVPSKWCHHQGWGTEAEKVFDNLDSAEVEFLSPWCTGEAPSPRERLIRNPWSGRERTEQLVTALGKGKDRRERRESRGTAIQEQDKIYEFVKSLGAGYMWYPWVRARLVSAPRRTRWLWCCWPATLPLPPLSPGFHRPLCLRLFGVSLASGRELEGRALVVQRAALGRPGGAISSRVSQWCHGPHGTQLGATLWPQLAAALRQHRRRGGQKWTSDEVVCFRGTQKRY